MTTDEPQYSSGSLRDHCLLLAIAAVGALGSLATTGHLVGVRNDIYFQPILAALYDEPQFANDPFIQSLHYYSSGLWQLLSGAERYVDISWLLLGLHFVSVTLAFLGLLACAGLLGIRSLRQRLFLTGLLCATSFLRGQSLAGDGGLFINYFTHSEIDNGLTLLILYMLLRRWLIAAVATDGIVFFVNAFIGAWDAILILAVATAMALRGVMPWRRLLLQGLIGAVLAAVPALPILHDILTNPDFGQPLGFDYVTFLEEFWPYHFLFMDIGLHEVAALAAMVALGAISFVALVRKSTFFLIALASFAAVYAVGIILPFLTHSAIALNLHLLRASTMLQLLAMLGCLSLATRWWFSTVALEADFLAPALVLIMCIPVKMTTIQPALHAAAAALLVVVAIVPAARRRIPDRLFHPRLRLKFWTSIMVATSLVIVIGLRVTSNVRASEWISEWRSVAQWARTNTSPDDLFLVPTWSFQDAPSVPQTADEADALLNSGAFEAVSHRALWIDFRHGAAVMWSPSYYRLWHRRVAEVSSLSSTAARLTYAKAHEIRYLIDVCRPDAPQPPVFSTRRLCIYAAP